MDVATKDLFLHVANNSRTQLVSKLLAASPDHVVKIMDEATNHSLLNVAALHGDASLVSSLIAAGADVQHADSKGHSSLHHLVQCEECNEQSGIAITKLLLDAGADPIPRDTSTKTPVDWAIRRSWYVVTAMLNRARIARHRWQQGPEGHWRRVIVETPERNSMNVSKGYEITSKLLRLFEPRGIYAVPTCHIKTCDLPAASSLRTQQAMFTDSEWDQLRDVLRSSGGMLPYNPPIPCNETDRVKLPGVDVENLVQSSSIVFGALIRDAESYLERNLIEIMQLGRRFQSYRFFYTENDSRDGTRAILTDFTHRHPDVFHGEMRDGVAAIASVQTCEAERLARNCHARIELLAGLRQRVFDMAMKHSDWDAVVMLDLDFVYFTHQDFLQTFAVGMRLDAAAIFGQSVYRNNIKHCVLYDTGSYVAEGWWARSAYQQRVRRLQLKVMSRGCVGLVQSGHGGFPILYAKALRAANPLPRYAGHDWADPKWANVVDMVPFNLMLEASAMNKSLPPHKRRPLVAYSRFRPLYKYAAFGVNAPSSPQSLALCLKPPPYIHPPCRTYQPMRVRISFHKRQGRVRANHPNARSIRLVEGWM